MSDVEDTLTHLVQNTGARVIELDLEGLASVDVSSSVELLRMGQRCLELGGRLTVRSMLPTIHRARLDEANGTYTERGDVVAKDHGPQVKDDEQYERLRRQGMSKEKAARIANTDRKEAGRRGGRSQKYEDWTKEELYEKARDVGIEGRSSMSKQELIRALRNH